MVLKRFYLLFICLQSASLFAGIAEADVSAAYSKKVLVKRSLASACKSQRSLSGGEIWKSRQSPHIPTSDRRKFSTALIYTRSARAPSGSCLSVLDSKGKEIHKLGIYARGESLYSARFYGGAGCGDAKSPSTIAALAKRNTGNTNVYIDTGSVCLKIPDPRQCYNSVGC